MTFAIEKSSVGGATVVSVRGEVDANTAPQLRSELNQTLDEGARVVVVDLIGVDFIDSSGLGTLVAARNHAMRSSATVAIACAGSTVLRMMRITGLDRVFTIHESLDDVRTAYTESDAAS